MNCAIDRRKYKDYHSDDVKYNVTCVCRNVQSLSLPQNSYLAIVVPILMSIKVHFRSLFTFSQSSSISICCNLSSSMLIFLLSCFVRRLWSLLSCSFSALTWWWKMTKIISVHIKMKQFVSSRGSTMYSTTTRLVLRQVFNNNGCILWWHIVIFFFINFVGDVKQPSLIVLKEWRMVFFTTVFWRHKCIIHAFAELPICRKGR